MIRLVAVGLGGLLGSIARHLVTELSHFLLGPHFPYGTLLVNLLGCTALGALLFWSEEHQWLSPEYRAFLAVGVLGSFTTFSTFAYESHAFLRSRDVLIAGLHLGGHVFLGLLAVGLGRFVARSIAS